MSADTGTRVAIVGGGVMGEALLTAVLAGGWPPNELIVAERHTPRAQDLARMYEVETIQDVPTAVADRDVVLCAVKPQDMVETLGQIAPRLKPGAIFVTVAAGMPASVYEEHLGPEAIVVRAMPNTPALVSAGATAIAAGTHARDGHLDVVREILAKTGLVVTVKEDEIDAVIAVSGSGPAYFFAFVEALTDAGVAQGLDREESSLLAQQTLIGAAQLLKDSGESPRTLRERVSSPGGTTLAALEAMRKAGLNDVVSAGARAAVQRSRSLAEENRAS